MDDVNEEIDRLEKELALLRNEYEDGVSTKFTGVAFVSFKTQ